MRDYIDALQSPLDVYAPGMAEIEASLSKLARPPKKRKKPAALTPRSMALLAGEGYLVEKVEHRNAFMAHVTHDLWQFADLLAIRRGEVLAVQVTSAANHATRRTKIADNPKVGRVREAGIRIEIHSWRKDGNRWQVRREDLS